MTKRSKIIERIKQMRLHSKDAASLPGEAASYAAKAAKLVEEYMITDAELDESKDDELLTLEVKMKDKSEAKQFMLDVICHRFGCLMVDMTDRPEYVMVVGRELNIDTTVSLFKELEKQVDEISMLPAISKGMYIGIAFKILDIMKGERSDDNPGNLPILVGERSRIIETVSSLGVAEKEKYNPIEELKSDPVANIGARMGYRMDINKGVK